MVDWTSLPSNERVARILTRMGVTPHTENMGGGTMVTYVTGRTGNVYAVGADDATIVRYSPSAWAGEEDGTAHAEDVIYSGTSHVEAARVLAEIASGHPAA